MAATRLDMPAIEYIMSHIDEYRESLAKEVETDKRDINKIPDYEHEVYGERFRHYNNGLDKAATIIRRT